MNTLISKNLTPDRLLTSHEVGLLLQVNPSSINKWVNEGRIPAFRTPGGHRRIKVADLLTFLTEHGMPVPPELEEAGKRRVLVVDDNAKLQESLKRALRKHSSRVDAQFVGNGIDALLQMGSFRPHLVVLDVYMPGFDGIEVCKRMKAIPEFKSIDVIITSGQLTPEIEKKAVAAGARRCFDKPFEVEQLLSELGINVQAAARH